MSVVKEKQVGYSIRLGYKQTEVGLIPEDWELTTVGMFTEKVGSGITPRGGRAVYLNSGRPFVRSQNVGWGKLLLDDLAFIDEATHSTFTATEIANDDVMLNITGASIGRCCLADNRIAGGNVNQHVCLIRSDTQRVVPLFLQKVILSAIGQRQIDSFQAGGNREGLNFSQVRSIQVPLPPTLAEQEAIAEALGDADALVESLERLLAKKRNLKQSAMQQLLTGKKRLPGFEKTPGFKESDVGVIPKDWDIRLLPEVAHFRGGKAHEQFVSDSGNYICVNSKFISSDGAVRKHCTKSFCTAKPNDVLMVMSDLPNGKALAKAYYVARKDLYAVNQRVRSLSAFDADAKYLYYKLNRNPYFLKFDDGVTQTHLLNAVFEKCPIACPIKIEEQTAIATVLSDMDAEIAVIEAKIDKARLIKAGMMQELLTGKTRLV